MKVALISDDSAFEMLESIDGGRLIDTTEQKQRGFNTLLAPIKLEVLGAMQNAFFIRPAEGVHFATAIPGTYLIGDKALHRMDIELLHRKMLSKAMFGAVHRVLRNLSFPMVVSFHTEVAYVKTFLYLYLWATEVRFVTDSPALQGELVRFF